MDIVFNCLGMPFGPTTVYESSLGGSESAAFYLCRELGRRGHRVTLFTNRPAADEEVEGVRYLYAGELSAEAPMGRNFEFYARNTPHDVLIVQRAPAAFAQRYAAKVCLLQLHDLPLKRFAAAMLASTWQLDAITCVSEWHCERVRETWMVDERVLFTVPNGVDPDLYRASDRKPFVMLTDDEPGRPEELRVILPRKKFNLLYQSRPERGLEHLVRPDGIMDRVRHLPVHLTICGYDNTVPQMREQYATWFRQAAALPNVSYVGALTKPQLAELQRKCDVLIYPTEFEEVSCITAMEAMHAGLPFLSSACAALPETTRDSGAVLIDLKDGKADEDGFVRWLGDFLSDAHHRPRVLDVLRQHQLTAARSHTWGAAADKLIDVIDTCFERRLSGAGAIMRTAIERSDIDFARWYGSHHVCDGPIAAAAMREIDRLYAFTASDEAYAAHYALHQGAYYDGPGARAVGEDVTQSTRFRGVMNLLEGALLDVKGTARVLDYGCAHGHYTMPLARHFVNERFVGMDISDRAIDAARGWAERDGLKNVEFMVGHEGALEATAQLEERSKFDVIIAGEVLEHARDWRRLLELLRACLRPGGQLIITTPFGRWEHSGTEAFRTAREHLVHFERQDILDVCEGHEVELLFAPASVDRSSELLGSWLWRVRPQGERPFGDIDYDRKLTYYAPRETISLCMIVKDAEKTLRKCVESVIDWVDEVRIFIDPTTSDRTNAVIEDLCDDFPNRPFMVNDLHAPVLETGFDFARNESTMDADGDWVLWCDADEEVHGAAQLHRLVRPSMHDGYGLPQVHYALDPAQVLTVDYPCRLFRNRIGIRFYGVVHEHPELRLGEAIPTSIMRTEVKFLHCGYVDEEVRRRRHERNLPLLRRDRELYPTRKLNQFLWLRDLAQAMVFQQQVTGVITEQHVHDARAGVALFESMVGNAPVRMLSECLPYYSHLVTVLQCGFEARVNFKTQSPMASHLAVEASIEGRFHDREFFKRLVAYYLEESTKTYEDPRL